MAKVIDSYCVFESKKNYEIEWCKLVKSLINCLLHPLFELTKKISDKLGKMVYLADPYSPWQRVLSH